VFAGAGDACFAAPRSAGVGALEVASRSDDPVRFGYLPDGFTVGPVDPQISWDDFQESSLYESKNRREWAVWVSGFAFPGGNFCQRIPKSLRPSVATTRLARIDQSGNLEQRTERTALLRGGASVSGWFFGGDAPLVPLRPPSQEKSQQISALVVCSSGASVISSGRLTRSQLVERFRDTTHAGSLVMTEFAPASNPVRSRRLLTGPTGIVDVVVSTDPRTLDGIARAGTDRSTVRGKPAVVAVDERGVSLRWFERPGLLVTVQSATVTPADLVRIGAGMTVSDG
jgi:hypothetical protein